MKPETKEFAEQIEKIIEMTPELNDVRDMLGDDIKIDMSVRALEGLRQCEKLHDVAKVCSGSLDDLAMIEIQASIIGVVSFFAWSVANKKRKQLQEALEAMPEVTP